MGRLPELGELGRAHLIHHLPDIGLRITKLAAEKRLKVVEPVHRNLQSRVLLLRGQRNLVFESREHPARPSLPRRLRRRHRCTLFRLLCIEHSIEFGVAVDGCRDVRAPTRSACRLGRGACDLFAAAFSDSRYQRAAHCADGLGQSHGRESLLVAPNVGHPLELVRRRRFLQHGAGAPRAQRRAFRQRYDNVEDPKVRSKKKKKQPSISHESFMNPAIRTRHKCTRP